MVISTSLPQSTLKKRHVALSGYHQVREAIAANILLLIPGKNILVIYSASIMEKRKYGH